MKEYVYNILVNQQLDDLVPLKSLLLNEIKKRSDNDINEYIKNILFKYIKETEPPKMLYNNKIKTFYKYKNGNFEFKIRYDTYTYCIFFRHNNYSLSIQILNINDNYNPRYKRPEYEITLKNSNEILSINDSFISWMELNNDEKENEVSYGNESNYYEFNNKSLNEVYENYLKTQKIDYESLDFIFLNTEKTYPILIYFLKNIEQIKLNFLNI